MPKPDKTPPLVLPLSAIVRRIEEEVALAKAAEIKGLALFIDSVVVDLTIATTTDAGGSVRVGVPAFEILQAGGKLEQLRSSRLVVTLGRTPAPVAQNFSPKLLADFKLAETITEAQRQLAEGIAAGGAISPTELTLEIIFGATQSSEAKGGVELWVFNLQGSGAAKQVGSNKITLKFEARTG